MLGTSDWPVVIVTSRGRRTGTVRKFPLMRVGYDGEYALIGSLGGAPNNPIWVYNLRADPDAVTLQDGPEPFAVTVRETTGDERALWWKRAVEAYPPYEDYQKRTEPLIPVFVVTPRDNDGDRQGRKPRSCRLTPDDQPAGSRPSKRRNPTHCGRR